MDYDMIEKMKVEELKYFLKLRGLKLMGRKKELVARVFSAIENGVLPVKTAVEVEEELKNQYMDKLKIDGRQLPDPFKVPHGWMNEDEGMAFWPTLLYPDIFNYLMFYPTELGSKDLSDYKNSKAYSYYKSGWLQPLNYHNLSGSNFCMMKGDCRKSQSIHDPHHTFWIILEKKSAKIRACHCTCMAGMGQTCNHVAAAMYRVEAAVRIGLTNPACTSSVNEWLPSKQDIAPSKIKNINFNREDFAQRGKKKRPLVATPKKVFNPLMDNKKKLLSLTDIAKALKEVAPSSIIHTAVPKPKIDFTREIVNQKAIVPEDLCSIDDVILMSTSTESFKSNLVEHFTDAKILQIEKITQGQSANENWFNFRKGVITATKSHEVSTKINSIMRGGCGYVNMWSLNQKISGFTFVNPNIPALKYGRTMEVDAVNTFCDVMQKCHKELNVMECGLYLHKNYPYIGASPDRLVTCACCLPACLEVKCPYSINYTSPTDPDVKLAYLKRDSGQISLNRSHKYYTQMQVQMAVTGLENGYFFIWTPHGHYLEHVVSDVTFWASLEDKIVRYYEEFYLKSIFSE